MKRLHWYLLLASSLILFSVLSYAVQIFIFKKPDDTFFYLLQDLSFVPIQVLLVTLFVEQLLNQKDKRAMRHKLNMVIGAFYTEMGAELLKTLSSYDENVQSFRNALFENMEFSETNVQRLRSYLKDHDFRISSRNQDFPALKKFLVKKRDSLMQLLENQNLLEHETFTDLMWAVSHLTEELSYRDDVIHLTEQDRKHLEGDIKRAYTLLTVEWLTYVQHLRKKYPYIFSLVVRINPFDPNASAEIKNDAA